MFTGLIESVGRVERSLAVDVGRSVHISTDLVDQLAVGQSVAVNGACLTVNSKAASGFEAIVIHETLRKTTLGDLRSGDLVNLERALRLGDRLDGHFVQGHVDTTSVIRNVTRSERETLCEIALEPQFEASTILHGSIAIDGISLTIAALSDHSLTVALIPHTLEQTCASSWRRGSRCNLEFDMIGKYVARQQATRP